MKLKEGRKLYHDEKFTMTCNTILACSISKFGSKTSNRLHKFMSECINLILNHEYVSKETCLFGFFFGYLLYIISENAKRSQRDLPWKRNRKSEPYQGELITHK